MLLTFKCKGAGNVLMYEVHAKPILDLLDKDITRGVITSAETGDAASRLEALIADYKAAAIVAGDDSDATHGSGKDGDERAPVPVSFGARAYPFLELLRTAHKNNCDIYWGI